MTFDDMLLIEHSTMASLVSTSLSCWILQITCWCVCCAECFASFGMDKLWTADNVIAIAVNCHGLAVCQHVHVAWPVLLTLDTKERYFVAPGTAPLLSCQMSLMHSACAFSWHIHRFASMLCQRCWGMLKWHDCRWVIIQQFLRICSFHDIQWHVSDWSFNCCICGSWTSQSKRTCCTHCMYHRDKS